MTEKLEQHGIQKTVNRTWLKETVLKHFLDMTEEKGTRDRVFIVCSKEARKIISDFLLLAMILVLQGDDGRNTSYVVEQMILRNLWEMNHQT